MRQGRHLEVTVNQEKPLKWAYDFHAIEYDDTVVERG